jgi:hypothetical protein
MVYLLLPSFSERQRFFADWKKRRILTVFHSVPLPILEMGRRYR